MAEDYDYPIDLGREMDGLHETSMPMKMGMDKEVYYPELRLEWAKPYDLPDAGTMTVRFKKVSESMDNHRDEKKYCVGLEILEILDTKEEVEEKKSKSTGEVLDSYIEEGE